MKYLNAFCAAILMTGSAVSVTPSAVSADDAVPDFTQPFTISFSTTTTDKRLPYGSLVMNTKIISESSLPYVNTGVNFGATQKDLYDDLYYRKSEEEPVYGYIDFNSGQYNTSKMVGCRLKVPLAGKVFFGKVIIEARTDVESGVTLRMSIEEGNEYDDSYYEDVHVAYGDEFAYYTFTFPENFWEHSAYPDGRDRLCLKLDRYADEAKTTLAHCEVRSITIVPVGSDWTPPGETVKTPVSMTVAGSTGSAGTDFYYRQLDEYRMDGDLVSPDYPRAFFIPIPVVRDADGEIVRDITAFDFDVAIEPIPLS